VLLFANTEPKGFYMDLSGFGGVTPTPGYSLTDGYLDWWTLFPSSATGTTNAFTYAEHFVVTPNDTGIHLYTSVNPAATDIAAIKARCNGSSATTPRSLLICTPTTLTSACRLR
jgi:hypothetical protein